MSREKATVEDILCIGSAVPRKNVRVVTRDGLVEASDSSRDLHAKLEKP